MVNLALDQSVTLPFELRVVGLFEVEDKIVSALVVGLMDSHFMVLVAVMRQVLLEELSHFRVRGFVYRGFPVKVPRVGLRMTLEKELEQLEMALSRANMQWVVLLVIKQTNRSTVLDKEFANVEVAVRGSDVERCLLFGCSDVDVRVRFDEDADDLKVPFVDRVV